MRTTILCVLIALCSFPLWAADKFVRPNIKTGLWEMTETHTMAGMPAMPSIPPEALARMTPEQRAQMEAHMKDSFGGGPKTTTRKYCVTQEKLDKDALFNENRKECTQTIVNSSATGAEVKIHCVQKDMTVDGTSKYEAISADSVKGSNRMVMTGSDHTMHMDFDFTSKYLGSACGDVK